MAPPQDRITILSVTVDESSGSEHPMVIVVEGRGTEERTETYKFSDGQYIKTSTWEKSTGPMPFTLAAAESEFFTNVRSAQRVDYIGKDGNKVTVLHKKNDKEITVDDPAGAIEMFKTLNAVDASADDRIYTLYIGQFEQMLKNRQEAERKEAEREAEEKQRTDQQKKIYDTAWNEIALRSNLESELRWMYIQNPSKMVATAEELAKEFDAEERVQLARIMAKFDVEAAKEDDLSTLNATELGKRLLNAEAGILKTTDLEGTGSLIPMGAIKVVAKKEETGTVPQQ